MKMRKTLALAMAAAMTLSLAACGGGNSSSQAASEDTSSSTDTSSSEDASGAEEGGFSYDGAAVTLTVSQHDPEASATGKFLNDWAAEVSDYTGGKITLNIYHGGALIASPAETLQGVTDGTCDIGFGLCSYYAGTLDRSNVCGLPGLNIPDSQTASEAEWAVWQSGLLDEEYANYHMLLLWANCASPISTVSKKLENVSDLKGMKVRANAGPTTIMTTEVLGCQAFGCPIGELVQNLQTGACEAAVTDWHGIDSFQVYEVCKEFMDGDFGCSAYWLIMNKSIYEGLDPALQEALDAMSGTHQIENGIGTYWIEAEANARAAAEAAGAEIYEIADQEGIQAVYEQTQEKWIASIDATYGDGVAEDLIDTFTAALQ